MSERKVLNKYYSPDFDPAKIPRRSKRQQQQINVRFMLPVSIRCGTCGSYIYKGTKFNAREEEVIGVTYLGIKILRFYFRCKGCAAEIVVKTDPKNSGYIVENGATRNFEPAAVEEELQVGDDPVEIRRIASKREMDNLSVLDELKSIKSRHAHVSVDSVLEELQQQSALLQLEEDKKQLDIFQRSQRRHAHVNVASLLVTCSKRSQHGDGALYKKTKPTYHYISVPKKSSVPQETRNGLTLLCNHYDTIDEEA